MEFHNDATGVDAIGDGDEPADTHIPTASPHHEEYFRNSSESSYSSSSSDYNNQQQQQTQDEELITTTTTTLPSSSSEQQFSHPIKLSQSVKNFDSLLSHSLMISNADDFLVITRMRSSTVCTTTAATTATAASNSTVVSGGVGLSVAGSGKGSHEKGVKSELGLLSSPSISTNNSTSVPTSANTTTSTTSTTVALSSNNQAVNLKQQSMKNVKRAQATREYKQNLELVFDGTNLLRNKEDVNTLDPKSVIFIDHFEYALIPDDVDYSDPLFLSQVERLKQIIEKEFNETGVISQCKRDAILWRRTLENPEYDSLGNILKRVFCVLRYGGLMYRQDAKVEDWKLWNTTRYPIASVLSHGSRVIIQLDSMEKGNHGGDEHAFWRWLITGSVDGDLTKIISTKTSGNEARIDGKVIFRRLGATHALDYYKPQPSDQLILDKPMTPESSADDELPTNMIDKFLENESSMVHYRQRRVLNVTKMMEEPPIQMPKKIIDDKYNFSLPMGKKKVLHETKTIGITFRDTKLFGTTDGFLKHHRHWGMNLPIGGAENRSLTGKKIEANGEHGHMYIYYQSPKKGRFGGLLIGVEGSEYSKYDQSGGYHSLSAKSPHFSPTFGYKWRGKDGHNDLSAVASPDKYNSLLVDLTGGWKFLIDKFENEWKDDFVCLTSLAP